MVAGNLLIRICNKIVWHYWPTFDLSCGRPRYVTLSRIQSTIWMNPTKRRFLFLWRKHQLLKRHPPSYYGLWGLKASVTTLLHFPSIFLLPLLKKTKHFPSRQSEHRLFMYQPPISNLCGASMVVLGYAKKLVETGETCWHAVYYYVSMLYFWPWYYFNFLLPRTRQIIRCGLQLPIGIHSTTCVIKMWGDEDFFTVYSTRVWVYYSFKISHDYGKVEADLYIDSTF